MKYMLRDELTIKFLCFMKWYHESQKYESILHIEGNRVIHEVAANQSKARAKQTKMQECQSAK